MYLNSNLLAQLMLSQLPGLVGALQPAAAGPANLSEMARRQRNQNNASAMLSAASGLLTPSPNRYPLGALQRLGAGLGAALQSHTDGANQVSILDALGMEGRGGQSRASATARSGAPGYLHRRGVRARRCRQRSRRGLRLKRRCAAPSCGNLPVPSPIASSIRQSCQGDGSFTVMSKIPAVPFMSGRASSCESIPDGGRIPEVWSSPGRAQATSCN